MRGHGEQYTVIYERVRFESPILQPFIPMVDCTVVCSRFYAEVRILTIDAILPMGIDVTHDYSGVQIRGTATKSERALAYPNTTLHTKI